MLWSCRLCLLFRIHRVCIYIFCSKKIIIKWKIVGWKVKKWKREKGEIKKNFLLCSLLSSRNSEVDGSLSKFYSFTSASLSLFAEGSNPKPVSERTIRVWPRGKVSYALFFCFCIYINFKLHRLYFVNVFTPPLLCNPWIQPSHCVSLLLLLLGGSENELCAFFNTKWRDSEKCNDLCVWR